MWSMCHVLGALSFFYTASGINNGKLVDVRKFPYVVAILLESSLDSYSCTGGIVSDKFVISAAHCFSTSRPYNELFFKTKQNYQERLVKVYPGVNNVRQIKTTDWYALAVEIYILKKYFVDIIADIALLKLDRSLGQSRIPFQKLKIPDQDKGVESDYKRGVYWTAGYGEDPSKDKTNPQNAGCLKQIFTVPIARDKCKGTKAIPIKDTKQLCCLSVENDATLELPSVPLGTCRGDSGSPIVMRTKGTDQETIIGLVGTGRETYDSRKTPEIHINVAAFVDDFIKPVIEDRVISYPTIGKYRSKV
ncbi:urokinase-type plasminogen activator-like [Phymastichus coffea]|uniref:urokinase-type plasminogen activator-like n=1 Tax=Phymastichus coffea TaxID=108790 RepID=UPI00273A98D2|nr:urokinase-type plasminogen activator-like [Phymastichus coffea]